MAGRFDGEATIETLFGMLKPGSASRRDRYVPAAGPVEADSIFSEAAKVARDDQYFPAPPGYLPYGAVFSSVARMIGGRSPINYDRLWSSGDRDFLARKTANHICRMLMAGEMSAAVAPDAFINTGGAKGYYTLPITHWHSDKAVERCEEGLLYGRGHSFTRFVIVDKDAVLPAPAARDRGGRPNKTTEAVNTYYSLYPISHRSSPDSALTWEAISLRVAVAGAPKVLGATLSPAVRNDPRWPKD